MGIVLIAVKAMKLELALPVRELAAIAGTQTGASRRALTQLCKAGFLVCIHCSGYGRPNASTYRIAFPEPRPETAQPKTTPPNLPSVGLSRLMQGLVALGDKRGMAMVWLEATVQPGSSSEIGARLGIQVRTVRSHVAALIQLGLARIDEDKVVGLNDDARLETRTRETGRAVRLERRIIRFADEQARHLKMIEHHRRLVPAKSRPQYPSRNPRK